MKRKYPDEMAITPRGPAALLGVMGKKTARLSTIPTADLYSEIGRRRQASRKTRTPGPGRPRIAPRCPCGAMTIARAKARRHVCRRTTSPGEPQGPA